LTELCERAVDLAIRAGASYADARIVERATESLQVKNGKVEALQSESDLGLGVRVLVEGAWGFAASADLGGADVQKIAEDAVRLARASALTSPQPAVLSEVEPARATWKSEWRTDPFEVPMQEKMSLLLEADRRARQREEVKVCESALTFVRERKYFASSEGSRIEQERLESGGGVKATAIGNGEMQERSYPSALDGFHAAGGWEVIEGLDLLAGAEKIGSEAADLLTAPVCPSGTFPIIIGASQMALQIHESCGHPIELDRVFGSEASYAGTSFLTPEKIGQFRYGSPLVNIVADSTVPGGLGTFAYDDEGVPSCRTDIVREGVFCGYLMSRETAARLGLRSNGAMRADGWNRLPLIRMTNINLEPGTWTLDEMISEIKHGFMLENTRSWSIDDVRLNFQFTTEIGWEIRDGSIVGMVRNPTYHGVTPQFWAACDAIASKEFWKLWGVVNCGKGEPAQSMRVGHGAAPARFSAVRLGAEQ
jgi:TldD protein